MRTEYPRTFLSGLKENRAVYQELFSFSPQVLIDTYKEPKIKHPEGT